MLKQLSIGIFVLYISVLSGQNIENFTLSDLTNKQVQLYANLGSDFTILDFWATWCLPCKKAMKDLNKLYKTVDPASIQIIGINTDSPQTRSKVRPYVRINKIQYPVLYDNQKAMMRNLNITRIPHIIILDKSGKVLFSKSGYGKSDLQKIESIIGIQ
jgi:cytochrome c biogenesis protein CcmG/thiol:disulfide interchange protein DsbE